MALKTSLVSFWFLDESSGNAADQVGSNTLTNTGTLTYAAGKINNGAVFADGKYLTKTDNAGLSITGDISISLWVKFSGMPADRASLISKPGDAHGSYEAYHIELNKNGSNYDLRALTTIVAATQTLTYASWNPSLDTWYHVVYTRNATSGQQTLYVNGSQVAQATNTSGSANDNTSNLSLGRFGTAATNLPLDGMLDEVGLWSARVLTSPEVGELYNASAGIAHTDLFPTEVNVSDAITLTENLSALFVLLISAVDSLSLSESVAMTNTLGNIVLFDAVSISEFFFSRNPAKFTGIAHMRLKMNDWPLPMDDDSIL